MPCRRGDAPRRRSTCRRGRRARRAPSATACELGGVEVGDDDLPALARQSGRDGAADPPGGPGDDGGVGHAAPREWTKRLLTLTTRPLSRQVTRPLPPSPHPSRGHVWPPPTRREATCGRLPPVERPRLAAPWRQPATRCTKATARSNPSGDACRMPRRRSRRGRPGRALPARRSTARPHGRRPPGSRGRRARASSGRRRRRLRPPWRH